MYRLHSTRSSIVALSFFLFALTGCQSGDDKAVPVASAASSAESSSLPEPILEATTVKVEVDGQTLVRLTSFLDDFEITLPNDFRGTVLTDREIASFASRIKSDVSQLADQIRVQCDSLRGSGGVVFAMNMRPSGVVDGFADNMNVSIRGMKDSLSLEMIEELVGKELAGQKPGTKMTTSEIDSEAGKMLEFRFDSQEGAAKINVTRFIFATARKNQIFMIAFACAKSKATKIGPVFRKSAQSLSYL